jgi:hypothetical protein
MNRTSNRAAPKGFPFTDGEAAESRYRRISDNIDADCTRRTGLLVGALIGDGGVVLGFSPRATLDADETPGLFAIAWAQVRTCPLTTTRPLALAATAAAVFKAGLSIGAYTTLQAAMSAAIVEALPAVRPKVAGVAVVNVAKLPSHESKSPSRVGR